MVVWIKTIEDAAVSCATSFSNYYCYDVFLPQTDKGRRGTVSNGQASLNPGTVRSDSIPEEKGAIGGPNRDSDDSFDDDE